MDVIASRGEPHRERVKSGSARATRILAGRARCGKHPAREKRCRPGVATSPGNNPHLFSNVPRKPCFFPAERYSVDMKHDVVPVQIRGILPANSGCAL